MTCKNMLMGLCVALSGPALAQTPDDAAVFPGRPHHAALRIEQSGAWHAYLVLELHQ